jgi:hypothetical protein
LTIKRTKKKSSRWRTERPKQVHKARKSKIIKEEKLPNINPSVREIWKIMRDGRVMYKKNSMIASIEDDCLDMESILPDLVQDVDFTFEDVVQFMHFLPSLLALCKVREIQVINIPIMPSLENYKEWKDEDA